MEEGEVTNQLCEGRQAGKSRIYSAQNLPPTYAHRRSYRGAVLDRERTPIGAEIGKGLAGDETRKGSPQLKRHK
jgi:hypothetical protein